MKCLRTIVMLIIVLIVALAVWVWSGVYNIGADAPHWAFTEDMIGHLREHSIDARSAEIDVPELDDPALIAAGARHYAGMCTGCHLAPGMSDSELRAGLYPKPPNLTRYAPSPAEAFWVIKHGIKMTAMPAWGTTHDDQKIWAMVAYLQKQPHMNVQRYRRLAGLDQAPSMAPPEHAEGPMHEHEHSHDHGHGQPATATSAPPAASSSAPPLPVPMAPAAH